MGQKNKIDFIEYEYKTNKKMSKHQELFDYFENKHNVLLLESEMKEIINIVDKIARNENKTIKKDAKKGKSPIQS